MTSSDSRPYVAAVIVSYNPDEDFSSRLVAHATEVDRIVVVDNSTDQESVARARSAVAAVSTCELLPQQGNLGLAVAQNAGIRRALELGAEWVMLLDDDSAMERGMVKAMFAALGRFPQAARVGMLAPRVVDEHSGLESKVIVSRGRFHVRRVSFGSSDWIDTALVAIASGSLIRAEALRACGLMREDFFIDGIDIDYCLRLRREGWKLLVVRAACLRHRLGEKTKHTLVGVPFVASNHSAQRRYTIMRNRVANWSRYGGDRPAYVAYDMAVAIFEALKIALFESDKSEKMIAMFKGLRDGLLGKFSSTSGASSSTA